MREYATGNYERISKSAARKMFLDGETVYLCPVNMRPGSSWRTAFNINRKDRERFALDEIGMNNDFTELVSSFERYNCGNKRGRYAAFYKLVTA